MREDLTEADIQRMQVGLCPLLGEKISIDGYESPPKLVFSENSYQSEEGSPGDIMIISHSHASCYTTIFEDEGETGYFSLCENDKELEYLDSLHIYDTDQVQSAIKVEIIWSEDGFKSALLINGIMHAAVNYEIMQSCCRTGFPPADSRSPFCVDGHLWTDECYTWFI